MTDAAPPISDLTEKTRYEPGEVEPRIEALWLEAGIHHPEPEGTAAENYSMAIPPPNVTGVLHMGHALNLSIQDTLARAARLRGQRVKWIHGTDHAGIATQTQVERLLISEGSSREAVGRAGFIERVWSWREEYGGRIVEQQKRLGASADYQDERFTMDPAYAQAVAQVFKSLYDKGLIYRDHYMVNWDPGSQSAISDLEIVERTHTDTLFYINYPLESGEGHLTVATVRPETMFADVAVAVNPEDDRYRHLIGQFVILPIVGRRLPVIADEYVKTEFGTGALKITPGHDPNDFEIGQRHRLEALSAIGESGLMEGVSPQAYQGLTVAEAQTRVVAELRELGALQREEPYTHTVPHSDRSGSRIEPLISLQWFMKMDELAAPAIQVVRDGRVRFHPANQGNVYLNWMENIRPWCISRQLWWGHQIPVWYRGDEVYCDVTPPEGEGWERDPDVLDTWFSSGLWPFATLGWPEQTRELQAFYPTDVLSTARDIIFLWVARMIMLGLEFMGDVPFSDVYIHSVIQAPDGQRMSKSKGTGVDPLDLINGGPRPPVYTQGGDFPAYGADALRWGLLAMSSAQDVRFNEEKIAQGRQLTNKLWNAARLILLRVGGEDARPEIAPADELTIEDRWILSRLGVVQASVAERIATFDFAKAAQELYDFVYAELCDWYLELIKPRLDDPALWGTALHVLSETLALAHPVIPFVTEEIHSYLPGAEGLLAACVAEGQAGAPAPDAERALNDLIAAVTAVRAWRDSAGVKPSAVLPARLEAGVYAETAPQLARLPKLEWSEDDAEPVAVIPVPGGQVAILPNAHVDTGAADAKREAERARLQSEIMRAERKLANPGFVAKAPEAVVAAEREKVERLNADLKALDDA